MQEHATAPLPASIAARLAVMVYESLLVVAVIFVASFVVLPVVGELAQAWQKQFFRAFLILVLFGYFGLFWMKGGQTLAMKTWRVRLIRTDGGAIGLALAAKRFVLAGLGLGVFGLGFMWALVDRERQFLHDRLLGTRLVRVSPRP